MPCSQRKARLLLKNKKAKIYSYHPFTIQLFYASGETIQMCHIGVDTGSRHIGRHFPVGLYCIRRAMQPPLQKY